MEVFLCASIMLTVQENAIYPQLLLPSAAAAVYPSVRESSSLSVRFVLCDKLSAHQQEN